MCTVSFVVSNNQVIITSNRDESVLRLSALEPKTYSINNKNIIFPKDPKAGGTWFAITESGVVLVLLNGAAEKHKVKSNYRKSRGLILLDIISAESPIEEWKRIDLVDIEPFTMVLYSNSELYQLRWNGKIKDQIQLDIKANYIWSSSTLYSYKIRLKRAQWFLDFLNENKKVGADDLLQFHQYKEESNADFGLVINRNNSLKTLSITQSIVAKEQITLSYLDLQNQNNFVTTYTNK